MGNPRRRAARLARLNPCFPVASLEFFPEVTKEASTGQNSTAVGNPKTTRSVIYANDDSSKKVTISVDQYENTTDASAAYEQAVEKSKIPGFKPVSVPNLGQRPSPGR